jgi:hypothetical protein
LETLDDAFARQAAEAQAAKLAQWQEIKTRAPNLAEFLKQMNSTFGKLQLKEIKFNQEESK